MAENDTKGVMAGTPHQDVYICCCVLGLVGAYIAVVNMNVLHPCA